MKRLPIRFYSQKVENSPDGAPPVKNTSRVNTEVFSEKNPINNSRFEVEMLLSNAKKVFFTISVIRCMFYLPPPKKRKNRPK